MNISKTNKSILIALSFIAPIVPQVNEISTLFQPTIAYSYVWIKFDCTNGTPNSPIPLTGFGNFIATDAQAENLCENSDEVICARKYEVTKPIGPQAPVKIVNGEAVFNANFEGGIAFAIETFEEEKKCLYIEGNSLH